MEVKHKKNKKKENQQEWRENILSVLKSYCQSFFPPIKDSDEEIHVVVVIGYHHIYFRSLAKRMYNKEKDTTFFWTCSISFLLLCSVLEPHAFTWFQKIWSWSLLSWPRIWHLLYDRMEDVEWMKILWKKKAYRNKNILTSSGISSRVEVK